MLKCGSAKQDAASCLGLPPEAMGCDRDNRSDPMDVGDDGDAGVVKSGGVNGEGRGGAGSDANGGGGAAMGKVGLGKGKLRPLLPGGLESRNGR